MFAHRRAVDDVRAFGGDLSRLHRLDARRRVSEIEHDEVEGRGERRIVQAREIRHSEVVVLVLDQ